MKKYDCSRTKDFMHEHSRMCEKYSEGIETPLCEGCPLKNLCQDLLDFQTTEEYRDWAVKQVQAWSDTHPKTRKDKFFELIKNTEFEGVFGFDEVGHITVDRTSSWWNEEAE